MTSYLHRALFRMSAQLNQTTFDLQQVNFYRNIIHFISYHRNELNNRVTVYRRKL